MAVLFDKRSIRIVTLSIDIIVLALAMTRLMYPSINGYLVQVQSIVTAAYLGYMGAYVGYDWGAELMRNQEGGER